VIRRPSSVIRYPGSTCRWARIVTNRRGSTFFRCGRAETDARFPRYPPLPVLRCVGYEQRRVDET